MNDKNINNLSTDEQSLLEVINASYLTIEDVKWLKSKKWFKKFLKTYVKELEKRNKNNSSAVKKIPVINDDDIEVLDFTKTIKIPQKEVIDILESTKSINITDANDIVKATKKAKNKTKRKRAVLKTIISISMIACMILIIFLTNYYLEEKHTDDMVEMIYDVAEVKEIKTTTKASSEEETTTTTTNAYSKYQNTNIYSINFDNLKNINPDTIGWIKVEGTSINYPYVQTTDNEFYLKHSFDRTKNKKGWVFLDYRNNTNFLDSNTILYAHGLMNNQMFGSMRNIVKPSWYKNKKNHIVTTVTSEGTKTWQVFSTYTIEPESYYITVNFSSDSKFLEFANTIKARSVYDFGVTVNKGDKILTLSSCYDNKKRMVLHAKLISG